MTTANGHSQNSVKAAQDQLKQSQEAMQLDQRAWVSVQQDRVPTLKQGENITTTILGKNLGKTPATNLRGKIYFEFVKDGEEPSFDYRAVPSYYAWRRGILIPNDADHVEAYRPGDLVIDGNVPPLPMAPEEFARFHSTYWLAVHVILAYDDIFHKTRWTEFCEATMNKNMSTIHRKSCTAHNSVGEGDPFEGEQF